MQHANALHFALCTLHFALCTQHSALSTLHPVLCIKTSKGIHIMLTEDTTQ
ncbi:hypothetical protein EDC52_1015 [Biostraticola tofi]|uniref:Uncharacterized protein n=1 Tax=Biostraticola tofi TaxID=466109 RepID=A0A4R3Z1P4_9GAMM|nr:hypothetical protein EDC52_1015 [Biostraticola tofi]